ACCMKAASRRGTAPEKAQIFLKFIIVILLHYRVGVITASYSPCAGTTNATAVLFLLTLALMQSRCQRVERKKTRFLIHMLTCIRGYLADLRQSHAVQVSLFRNPQTAMASPGAREDLSASCHCRIRPRR